MYGSVVILCYVTMALLLVLQYWSNKKLAELQYENKAQTDKRIALVQNIIKGIRQVKIRMQESVYIQRIGEVRNKEMQIYGKYVNLKQICTALYFNAGVIMSSAIFIFADPSTLELGKVFSTIALLGYVFNFSVLYSNYALEALYTIVVFNKRIDMIVLSAEKYRECVVSGNLALDENGNAAIDFSDNAKGKSKGAGRASSVAGADGAAERSHVHRWDAEKPHVKFANVSAIWSPTEYLMTQTAVIQDVSFEFNEYNKVALIGRVGCGKTTLLNTILKETFIQKGHVEVGGSRLLASYAEQNPLIVSGTVRSNIIYGSKFDEDFYQKVITACQLQQDIRTFPNGDLTRTGEMGVTLSGGQRSRISLARALYKRNAKIMLIDGTLSSLDSRVSSEILKEIRYGELFADKIVILVTYDLDQAEQMDWVLHMADDGSLEASTSSKSFFSQTDQQTLQNLKDKIKFQEDAEEAKEAAMLGDVAGAGQVDPDDNSQDKQADADEKDKKAEDAVKTYDATKEIIKDELKEVEKVDYGVCLDYFSFCTKMLGGKYSVLLILLLHILINLSVSSLSLYLAFSLTTLAGRDAASRSAFETSLISIMCVTLTITVLGKYISCIIFMSINKNMHQRVISSLINTKMAFFDENTSGAIINRLSADIQVTD